MILSVGDAGRTWRGARWVASFAGDGGEGLRREKCPLVPDASRDLASLRQGKLRTHASRLEGHEPQNVSQQHCPCPYAA